MSIGKRIFFVLSIVLAFIGTVAASAHTVESTEKDFTFDFVAKCRDRAEEGDSDGQALYGRALINGWGVESNHVVAVKWLQKAAEAGSAMGQCSLGACYEYGLGVEKDSAKAVELYRKAAEQGLPRAQCNLGVCYEYGDGVEKDEAKAVELYRKAAEQGFPRAQCYLGVRYMKGRGVDNDEMKAVELLSSAAEQGDAVAQRILAASYKYGIGVEKDMTKAFEWFRKAAEQGDATAQCNLGSCYEFGNGVKKDTTKAVEWYRKAADQGSAQGMGSLGVCYEFGKGVSIDMAKAAELYEKAIEQGDTRASKRYSWTTNDTERFWASVAANSQCITMAPRLEKANSEKGEGILESFGVQYMPNAYEYYEKVRATAIERELKFKENFPNGMPSDPSSGRIYEKVRAATVKAISEYFRRRDELCHYYLMHKAGAISDSQLSEIDQSRICIVLYQNGFTRPPSRPDTPTAGNLDFARKYKPETFAAYERIRALYQEGLKDFIEVGSEAITLDAVRSDAALAPLVDRLKSIRAILNSIVKTLKDENILHDVEEITAEQLADSDAKFGLKIREIEETLHVRDYVVWYVENYLNGEFYKEAARCDAPVFALEFSMVPIPGKEYAICKHEATQGLWYAVMGSNPSKHQGSDNYPVENVSWNYVKEFIVRLNSLPEVKEKGWQFRLPTKKEWLFACRTGMDDGYGKLEDGTLITGTNLASVAWFLGQYDADTQIVCAKQPNAFGLFDMLGNVSEFTSDNPDIDIYHLGGSVCMDVGLTDWNRNLIRQERKYGLSKDIGFRLARDFTESERKEIEQKEAALAEVVSRQTEEKSKTAIAELVTEMVPIPNRKYAVCKYEVTQALWFAVMNDNPSFSKGADLPIECVSWNDVQKFLGKLNALPEVKKAGFVYRLPSVEEWEFACLAGAKGKDSYCLLSDGSEITNKKGNERLLDNEKTIEALADVAWYWESKDVLGWLYQYSSVRSLSKIDADYEAQNLKSHAVGQKTPNAFGLYDMHGNVYEWTSTYDSEGNPIVCGGCFAFPAKYCKAGHKNYNTNTSRDERLCQPSGENSKFLGFRLVRDLTDEEMNRAVAGRAAGFVSRLATEMVAIPGKSFSLSKYEVTEDLYEAIMGENPSNNGAHFPVQRVSWDDCQKFIDILNSHPDVKSAGYKYRLPTVDEWIFACRSGSKGDYCKLADGTEISKETIGRIACLSDNGGLRPVGQKEPNAFGLYDMFGNVEEWTSTPDGASQQLALRYGPDKKFGLYYVVVGGNNRSDSRFLKLDKKCCSQKMAISDCGFRLAR